MANMKIDIETTTGGRFVSRVTNGGAPSSFETNGDVFCVVRERGESQKISCSAHEMPVALCGTDGTVLGYGSVDLRKIDEFVTDVDAALGKTEGKPFARLSSHGLRITLPLDGVSADVRNVFLGENVAPDFLMDTSIDDELIEKMFSKNEDQLAPGEKCSCCDDGHSLDDIRNSVEEIISKAGHAVMGVMADDETPGFSYTVGLADAGWPELVLTGIFGEQGQMILNAAVSCLRRQDKRPANGMILTEAVNFPLRLRSVDISKGHEWARLAGERHVRKGRRPEEFLVLQVLWPDHQGRLPDESGYDGSDLPPQVLI